MFVLSNIIGSTIQITTLPLPVLSTLQASGLVFNTAFATLILKEPFTRYSVVGTVLTCTGAALIATFGAIGEPAHNLRQLIALLKQGTFIAWMATTLAVAVFTILFAHVLKMYSSHKHIIENWFDKTERPTSAAGQSPSRLKRSLTMSLPRPMQLRLSRLRLVRGLSYALISGILSAHSLLMAKSAVELVVRTLVDHKNQFDRFQSWLILLALVFFALTQLYYLHLGLRLCSTSVLYPFVFCIYNVIAILDGLIYFQQGSRLSGLDAGLVALGTVVLLAGVLALSWRLDDTTPQDPTTPVMAPQTPLTPGLGIGIIPSPELQQNSPSLPPTRHYTNDERTPLIDRKNDIHDLLPEEDHHDIWAELDDEERSYGDVLASLPKTTSPFLKPRKTRRSSDTSSQALSISSEQSQDRRSSSRTKHKPSIKGDGRRASAPQSTLEGLPGGTSSGTKDDSLKPKTRARGSTVHFDLSEQRHDTAVADSSINRSQASKPGGR